MEYREYSFTRKGPRGRIITFYYWSESRGTVSLTGDGPHALPSNAHWYYRVNDDPTEYDGGRVEPEHIEADMDDSVDRGFIEQRIADHYITRIAAGAARNKFGAVMVGWWG